MGTRAGPPNVAIAGFISPLFPHCGLILSIRYLCGHCVAWIPARLPVKCAIDAHFFAPSHSKTFYSWGVKEATQVFIRSSTQDRCLPHPYLLPLRNKTVWMTNKDQALISSPPPQFSRHSSKVSAILATACRQHIPWCVLGLPSTVKVVQLATRWVGWGWGRHTDLIRTHGPGF